MNSHTVIYTTILLLKQLVIKRASFNINNIALITCIENLM